MPDAAVASALDANVLMASARPTTNNGSRRRGPAVEEMAIPAPVNLLQFNYALPFLHIGPPSLSFHRIAGRQVRYFRDGDDDDNDADGDDDIL